MMLTNLELRVIQAKKWLWQMWNRTCISQPFSYLVATGICLETQVAIIKCWCNNYQSFVKPAKKGENIKNKDKREKVQM